MATLYLSRQDGISGVRGTVISDNGYQLYRVHYADVQKGLYGGLSRGVRASVWIRRVVVDGEDITDDVAERLYAYIDGMVGGVDDDTKRENRRMIEDILSMLEEGVGDVLF